MSKSLFSIKKKCLKKCLKSGIFTLLFVVATLHTPHSTSVRLKRFGWTWIRHVSLTNSHIQQFGFTVSFRRNLLILRVLSHGQIIYFYLADASARTRSDTASTWCVCGTQKVWVNLLRINSVSLTSLHTRRGAFVGLKRFGWTFWGLTPFH